MFKSAITLHAAIQRILPSMAERCMTEAACPTNRLCQIFVTFSCPGDGASYLRNFDGMGEAGTEHITLMIYEYLRFVPKPAKSSRMNYAIAITLILISMLRLWFPEDTSFGIIFSGCITSQFRHQRDSVAEEKFSSVALSFSGSHWLVTNASPICFIKTRCMAPSLAFLSTAMSSSILAGVKVGGNLTGNFSLVIIHLVHSRSCVDNQPCRLDKSAAIHIPAATASPCNHPL